jgi:2-dehydropantoate 2-reductase
MRLGIIGAGAIGSYYAAQWARAGDDVVLLARGDHLRAIGAHGLTLREPTGSMVTRPRVTDDPAALRDRDVVLIAVKSYSLPEIADGARVAAESGALIVPLLNGVDAAARLGTLGVPPNRIAGGLARVSVVRTAPGVVERRTTVDQLAAGLLDVTGPDRSGDQARLDAMTTGFRKQGIEATVSTAMARDLWRKFAFIVPMGVACGLSRAPMGSILATPLGRTLLARAVAEIGAVNRAHERTLTPEDEQTALASLLGAQPHVKPSFLLDLERGGPTELDVLAGAVARMGLERHVPTPIHDTAAAAFDAATRHSSEG